MPRGWKRRDCSSTQCLTCPPQGNTQISRSAQAPSPEEEEASESSRWFRHQPQSPVLDIRPSSLLICPQILNTETLHGARCEHFGKKEAASVFHISDGNPTAYKQVQWAGYCIIYFYPNRSWWSSWIGCSTTELHGKKAHMISYEMCLPQLTSNKCMILSKQYILTESMLWRLGLHFSTDKESKCISEAFLLLNRKSSLLKPDVWFRNLSFRWQLQVPAWWMVS